VSVAEASKNLRWSVSVAAFGMILKESEYINHYPVDKLVVLAESAKGSDTEGYRSEFISMVKSFSSMARK
jgi:Ca-activated chloride channel family protein